MKHQINKSDIDNFEFEQSIGFEVDSSSSKHLKFAMKGWALFYRVYSNHELIYTSPDLEKCIEKYNQL